LWEEATASVILLIFEKNQPAMSNKTRSILKAVAVILVLLAVCMEFGWIIIPVIVAYKFWIVLMAFGILLLSSK
jgi:hypothetical protein